MFKALGTILVILAVAVGVTVALSPAVRVTALAQWAEWFGWNQETIERDPVGFTRHAERQLTRDRDQLQQTRRELAAEVGQLAREIRQQQALHDQTVRLADEFRAEYREAAANGGFPITVRNAAYTRDQAESQVSMVLAEMAGYEQSLQRLRDVQRQAERELEKLTVQINRNETQLAVIATQRPMLAAQQLSDDGEQLVAQLDALLSSNARVIEDNPVRSVRELVAATSSPSADETRRQVVADFLAESSEPVAHQVLRPTETEPQPADEQPADEKPDPVDEGMADQEPAGEEPVDEEPAPTPEVEVTDPADADEFPVSHDKPKQKQGDAPASEEYRPIFQQW